MRPTTILFVVLSLTLGCEADGGGEADALHLSGSVDAAASTDAAVDPPDSADAAGENPDAAAESPDGAIPDTAVAEADAAPEDPDPQHDLRSEIPVAGAEHDIGHGWIGFGQPSQDRLREVVGQGARVISLRYPEEESFDEQALVEGLGGSFDRYPTQGGQYLEEAFREGMFDLYDAQLAEGGTVYLHCASSNRVGASWALYHYFRRGYSLEEAVAVGREAGLTSLEELVRDVAGQ